jgi:glycosyltransferase involved in cell wall biosynthesis
MRSAAPAQALDERDAVSTLGGRVDFISDRSEGFSSVAPRRILYIDHTARLGGGEIALLNLIRKLDRARFEPVVMLFSDGPLKSALDADGIEVHLLPLQASIAEARKDSLGVGSLLRIRQIVDTTRFVARVARAIRQCDVALVHTNSLKADVIGGVAAKLAGVAVLWHLRDRIADDYLPASVVRAFRMAASLIPDYIIANSQATLRTLGEKTTGRAAVIASGIDRVRIVHDGVEFGPPPPPVPFTPHPEFVVGLVGRITPWKGQHIFLSAAEIVLQRFPSARFQLIGSPLFGEDDYERQLREQVKKLGIQGSVEFCGFCTDVGERITRLDLLVHASITGEPFGQVVVEGMAAGKAVVATNGGGIPEIVVDGETGILVPMGDVQLMAAAICDLLADPARRRKMGEMGRKRVLHHFTIDAVARNVERVYDEVLDDHRQVQPLWPFWRE